MRKTFGAVVIFLGILSGMIFFVAGSKINQAGQEMTELRSEGGMSLAEYYYQSVGKSDVAFSYMAYALGLAIISLSIGVGGTLIIKGE